jgi:hypothetical protein
MSKISQEVNQNKLQLLVNYNPNTGIFTWKYRNLDTFKSIFRAKTWNTRYAYKETGCITKDGYLTIRIDDKAHYAHRLAWIYIYGKSPKKHIDHINGIRTDNRIENLREADSSENLQNQRKGHPDSKYSKLLGVSFHKRDKKYVSQIKTNGSHKNLGYFNTEEEAYNAYLKAKHQLHPFGMI